MADKKIRIHLAASADLKAIHDANSALVQMARMAGTTNKAMSAASLRAMAECTGSAEKTASRVVLSAKQIEEAWRKAMTKIPSDAPKHLGRLKELFQGAAKSIGGSFSKISTMFLQGGIWGAMAAAITKVFTYAWDKAAEHAEKVARRVQRAFDDSVEAIAKDAEKIDKAFSKSMSSIDKRISLINRMTEATKEATKAQIDLAREIAVANGADRSVADAAAEDLKSQLDFDSEEARLNSQIEEERKRIAAAENAEIAAKEKKKEAEKKVKEAEKELETKRKDYIESEVKSARLGSMAASAWHGSTRDLSDDEIWRISEEARADFEDEDSTAKLRENIRKAKDELAKITTDEKAIAAAEDARNRIEELEVKLGVLADKRRTRELAVENELEEKAKENAKAQAEEEKRLAEERARAEAKAAQEAARERDRLDRELHQKRMDDLRAEIAAQNDAAAALKAMAADAQTEFERAFAMYRDPSRAAAEIAEERARAGDLKRLHRDASRYGGKWRVDELSALMSAGDAAGVQSRLEEWRKSKSFTPEVEAMVRASAAEQTQTTVEDELRKIEVNTAGLAQKLDELLAVKGGS